MTFDDLDFFDAYIHHIESVGDVLRVTCSSVLVVEPPAAARSMSCVLELTGVTRSERRVAEYAVDRSLEPAVTIVDIPTHPPAEGSRTFDLESVLDHPRAWIDWEIVAVGCVIRDAALSVESSASELVISEFARVPSGIQMMKNPVAVLFAQHANRETRNGLLADPQDTCELAPGNPDRNPCLYYGRASSHECGDSSLGRDQLEWLPELVAGDCD